MATLTGPPSAASSALARACNDAESDREVTTAELRARWERLQFALDGEPDPWFEHDKAAVDTRQFTALPA